MRRLAIALAAVLLTVAAALGPESGHGQGQGRPERGGRDLPRAALREVDPGLPAGRSGVSISYDAVGSGEGQRRFGAGSVDFGASDAALTDEQMARVTGRRPAHAGIRRHRRARLQSAGARRSCSAQPRRLRGHLRAAASATWNDPRIRAVNPGLTLPNRRSPSSRVRTAAGRRSPSPTIWARSARPGGTAGRASATWSTGEARPCSRAATRAWPARIKGSEDSIGYVEYHFAKRLGLPMAAAAEQGRPLCRAGRAGRSGRADAAAWPGCRRISASSFPTPTGEDAYPIVSYTWLLLYDRYPDRDKVAALQKVRHVGPHRGAGAQPRARLHSPSPGDRHAVARRGRAHRLSGRA